MTELQAKIAGLFFDLQSHGPVFLVFHSPGHDIQCVPFYMIVALHLET